jgi:DNA-binding NarL/FixJ family response regulator
MRRRLLAAQREVDHWQAKLDEAHAARRQVVAEALANGFTTREVAEILGLSQPQIVHIHNGARNLPAKGIPDERLPLAKKEGNS